MYMYTVVYIHVGVAKNDCIFQPCFRRALHYRYAVNQRSIEIDMLLPHLIYNLSDRGDEFSAAEPGNASACETRPVQARSCMRFSHASLARDRSPLPTLSLSQNKTINTNNTTTHANMSSPPSPSSESAGIAATAEKTKPRTQRTRAGRENRMSGGSVPVEEHQQRACEKP